MANIPYPPPRPLSVGEVLDLTFRIYRASVVSCLIFAALGVIANQLPNLYSVSRGATLLQALLTPKNSLMLGTLMLAGALLGLVFTGAVVLRQYAIATGHPVGGELPRSLGRLPGLVLLMVLFGVTFAVGAMFIGAAFIFSGIARVLLALLLCLPILYAVVAVSCSLTAMYVTPMGAAAAYVRSVRLTSGSFWRLSVIYTIGVIVLFVLYILTSGVIGMLMGILGRGDVAVITATLGVVSVAIGALATPFYTALGLAVFGDLTVRKEGADLAQRISAS
jgi:hypothetical protein